MPTTVRFTRHETEFDRSFRRAGYFFKAMWLLFICLFAAGITWAVCTPVEERARYQCAATLNPDECYRMLTGHDDPARSQQPPKRSRAQE